MGNRGALADGKVRFYGDPVAVVIADDRYTARDARDLIEVDYEPLPAAIDVEKAMQPDAPILYEEFGTNVGFSMHPPTDEIDKVFTQTQADGGIIVKTRLVNQRLAPVSMETRGVVAEYRKASKNLTVWSSSQIPHLLRKYPGCSRWSASASGTCDCTRSRWRLWLQTQYLSRRDGCCFRLHENRSCCQVD